MLSTVFGGVWLTLLVGVWFGFLFMVGLVLTKLEVFFKRNKMEIIDCIIETVMSLLTVTTLGTRMILRGVTYILDVMVAKKPTWHGCFRLMSQCLVLSGELLFSIPYTFWSIHCCIMQYCDFIEKLIDGTGCTFTVRTIVITARDKINQIGIRCLKRWLNATKLNDRSGGSVSNINRPDIVSVKCNKYHRRFKKTQRPTRL